MTEAAPVRCLFVAYAYPPISAPGAVRITRALKHFDRTRIDPWVLTASGGHSVREGGLADPLGEEPEKVVRIYDPLGGAASKVRSEFSVSGNNAGFVKQLCSRVFKLVSGFLVPDRRIIWALRCLWDGNRFHNKGISVVYSTSPSATNHIVGYFLSRKLGAAWIAEFRDPLSWLTEGTDLPWPKRAIMRWIEKESVKRADCVPVVSEPFAEYFRDRYPGANIVTIPNGADIQEEKIDEVLSDRKKASDTSRITLVHAGSLYGGDRDPRPLIIAAKLAYDEYGADVRVKFAGNDTHIAMQAASDLGAEELVEDLGNLAFEDAQRLLQQASANIILLNSDAIGKIGLMSKFFDYITAGAPIIVLGPTDSNLARIVEEDGAGRAFESSDHEEVAKYIAMVNGVVPPDTRMICAKWSAEEMAKLIEEKIVCLA